MHNPNFKPAFVRNRSVNLPCKAQAYMRVATDKTSSSLARKHERHSVIPSSLAVHPISTAQGSLDLIDIDLLLNLKAAVQLFFKIHYGNVRVRLARDFKTSVYYARLLSACHAVPDRSHLPSSSPVAMLQYIEEWIWLAGMHRSTLRDTW